MSNFDFLNKNEILKSFAKASIEAEESLKWNTVTCAILGRRALELAIKWIYANDKDLTMPYQNNLSALMYDITFKNIVDEKIFNEITYIVKRGNFAVHSNQKITREEAVIILKYLFDFMKWVSYCYGENYVDVDFDLTILPQENEDNLEQSRREKIFSELAEKDKKLVETLKENETLRESLSKKREEKSESKDFKIRDLTEFETREKYIDLELQIAGWSFEKNIYRELPVKGMPNEAGAGFVDYVLFGENGKPLAIVEAKRTSKDVKVGKQQAKLYADCLENECAQRPVIYYTNGTEIYMWDDMQYPERRVAGYYTQAELQTLINRRSTRESLDHIHINQNITNRPYQLEAVNKVCETFKVGHRKALLVMATGTGKTRTAISLVDVLANKNWAQNVLFLADRTELVKQAKKNFVKLLPDMSCCNLLSSKDNPEESRIVFSTYQTIINEIDNRRDKNGSKLFTPGHFDLIIIDEAHRSIYKKYQAIFEYFDVLLIGLTATPRNDVDKNTYRFFEIENDMPTALYEYETAVKEGYLVNYHKIKTTTEFLERGIKYSELKAEEKEEYENIFEDKEYVPDEINSAAINSWLFNRDTIKKILETLMDKGIKVEGGDKLGKTIIFAKNHKHAEEIVKIFDALYPHYKGQFASLIDNTVNYASSLIDDFEIVNKFPQIAVSVDMLDTGIDVPEVVNLVFFKPVKSKIKFWQMIGRGTRLCENLFGLGENKKEFYIFDCCKNFEFFEENQNIIESGDSESLTEKIYKYKLDLIIEFQGINYQQSKEYIEYRRELIDDFLKQIRDLNKESFIVKAKLKYIEIYEKEDSWNYISIFDKTDLIQNLIPVFIPYDNDEEAKRFDCLIYSIQVRRIAGHATNKQISNVIKLLEDLQRLGTVPQVKAKSELILKSSNEEYWDRAGFFDIESLRKELRDLIKFIEYPPIGVWRTDIEDTLIVEEGDTTSTITSSNFSDYKKRVSKFLDRNMDNMIIYKIKHNQKLTENEKADLERIMFEELGTNKEFADAFGDVNVIEAVKSIVGLDMTVAQDIFAKYIIDNRLNNKQIQFVKMLIDYVIKNGMISLEMLKEQPFNYLGSVSEVFGNNIVVFNEIREEIEKINRNAG